MIVGLNTMAQSNLLSQSSHQNQVQQRWTNSNQKFNQFIFECDLTKFILKNIYIYIYFFHFFYFIFLVNKYFSHWKLFAVTQTQPSPLNSKQVHPPLTTALRIPDSRFRFRFQFRSRPSESPGTQYPRLTDSKTVAEIVLMMIYKLLIKIFVQTNSNFVLA